MADAPREFMQDGLADLVQAIDMKLTTACTAATSRDAEEVAHALAISAQGDGMKISLPLFDRVHAFAQSVSGIKSLIKENLGKQ